MGMLFIYVYIYIVLSISILLYSLCLCTLIYGGVWGAVSCFVCMLLCVMACIFCLWGFMDVIWGCSWGGCLRAGGGCVGVMYCWLRVVGWVPSLYVRMGVLVMFVCGCLGRGPGPVLLPLRVAAVFCWRCCRGLCVCVWVGVVCVRVMAYVCVFLRVGGGCAWLI